MKLGIAITLIALNTAAVSLGSSWLSWVLVATALGMGFFFITTAYHIFVSEDESVSGIAGFICVAGLTLYQWNVVESFGSLFVLVGLVLGVGLGFLAARIMRWKHTVDTSEGGGPLGDGLGKGLAKYTGAH